MRDLNVKLGLLAALASFGVATACGDDDTETPPAATGGQTSTGGSASGSGGNKATGGTPGSSGAGGGPTTGGTSGSTGGTSAATGGTSGSTGGTSGATGGTSGSTGGASSGGASSGGASSGGASSGGASSGGSNGSGGAGSGTRCGVQCDLQGEKCGFGTTAPNNYPSRENCMAACSDFAAGTTGTGSGNNVECRITHLGYITSSSSAGDKATHCGHAARNPTANCVNN